MKHFNIILSINCFAHENWPPAAQICPSVSSKTGQCEPNANCFHLLVFASVGSKHFILCFIENSIHEHNTSGSSLARYLLDLINIILIFWWSSDSKLTRTDHRKIDCSILNKCCRSCLKSFRRGINPTDMTTIVSIRSFSILWRTCYVVRFMLYECTLDIFWQSCPTSVAY